MGSSKRQRNRGFLLSDRGKQKLETARQKAEELNNEGKRYTVEQLSGITGLDLSTISRVLDTSIRVDRRTLERLFKAFNLELKTEDFYKPQLSNQRQPTIGKPIYYPANHHNIYGRERELRQLKEYIFNERVVILYGTVGVGKTALAVKLVDEVKDSFKYVYWRSLNSTDSLLQVVISISKYFYLDSNRDFDNLIIQLIIFLQKQQCLIVFDNVEAVVDRQTRAFLNYLCTAVHKSCIVLISRQRLDTVASTKFQSLLIEEISLETGKKLLRDRSISTDNKTLEKLIQTYAAHPLSLHLVATTIIDIFDGNVEDFLAHQVTIFNKIEEVLKLKIQQLFELDISILYWLAVNSVPISLAALKEDMDSFASYNQIVAGLRKLKNYFLINKIDNKFIIQPFLQKYIINLLIEQSCKQIA